MSKKILIIDDDPDIVETMKTVLESKAYQVETASNGTEGLEKVKKFDPNLIILDVMMDSITEGFHVTYKLRSPEPSSEYAKWAKTPIVMVSAINTASHFKYSPQTDSNFLPVDEFLNKPIEPENLLAVVEKCLAKK
ncbi:MAG TPA: response regulator [Candidatus Wallbacteria bacterium]|jgi:CheY-like chemotaxis protein|nr:response regulator [Candidatus Wallbacteria bacterium]